MKKNNGKIGSDRKANGMVLNKRETLILNTVHKFMNRQSLAAGLGQSYGDNRDIYKVFGWKKVLTFKDYWNRYDRQGIATRIVDAPVEGSWRLLPTLKQANKEGDSKFQTEWESLVKEKDIYHYLKRVDKLARIYQYGVLVMGFDDANAKDGTFNKKVIKKEGLQLLYLLPFMQGDTTVKIKSFVSDTTNARYGLPDIYEIEFPSLDGKKKDQKDVHWTRVIHVAENLLDNDINGIPVLKNIMNYLEGLDLLAGSAPEMFYRNARRDLVLEAQEGADIDRSKPAKEALEAQIENWLHDLQPAFASEGFNVKTLSPKVADPTGTLMMLLKLIGGTKGQPMRILTGSEMGELASSQDEKAWNKNLDERRTNHNEPRVLREFVDRLIMVGVLPDPGEYNVDWPDISVPSEKEAAETASIRSTTLATYTNALGADQVIPPQIFLEIIMGLSREQIDGIVDVVGKIEGDLNDDGDEDEGNNENINELPDNGGKQ